MPAVPRTDPQQMWLMATLGAYSLLANEQQLKFPAVPVSELVAALPEAPQVI